MRVTDEQGNEHPAGSLVPGAIPEGQVFDTPQMPVENLENPLGEETIRVRAKPGVEFYNQGVLRRDGEEFDMPMSMARAAARYVDQVTPDGTLKTVPHEQQQIGLVEKANIAGRPRHERIGELEAEVKRLDERKAIVQKQLEHEHAQQAQATGKPPSGAVAVAPGIGGPGNETTTAFPPRPGE